MTFYISYLIEYSRVIAGIVLESRDFIPETKNKEGFEVKDYFDGQIALVTNGVLPYKVESESGSLAAYFSLNTVNGVTRLFQLFIRPNFADFQEAINEKINIFITEGGWKQDVLN